MQVPSFLHYVNVPYSTAVLSEYLVETEAIICSAIFEFPFLGKGIASVIISA